VVLFSSMLDDILVFNSSNFLQNFRKSCWISSIKKQFGVTFFHSFDIGSRIFK